MPVNRTATDLLLLLALSLAWASGYLFVSAADHGIPPLTATAAMALVAALVMVPAVGMLRRPLLQPLRRRPWVPAVMAVTAMALPNLALVTAERTVPADLASVLGTTVPISTLLLGALLARFGRLGNQARLTPRRLLGVGIALVGLAIFAGGAALLGKTEEIEGVLIQIGGGLIFAANGLFVGHQTEDLDGPALATWTLVFSVPLLAAAALVFEDPVAALTDPSGPALRGLLANGILSLAVAYLLYYALIARAGAWFASLYAFLVPPLGVLLVALTGGGMPTLGHLVGLAVVLVGLFLITRAGGAEGKTRPQEPEPG